jgi:hypothetical protein
VLARHVSSPPVRNQRIDPRQLKVQIAQDELSGSVLSVGMYFGLLVPGVVMTPIGALSSPAAIAFRIRAQNASSMSE